MIRVCHMTSVHPWGDVRIYHKECRSLAEAGFDVHLVACAPAPQCQDGVTLHAVVRAQGGRLGRMLKTAWRVYKAAKVVDAKIYHFHDPELLPYGLLLTWQGKQVVYDAHEDVPRDILSKPWIAPRLRRLIAVTFETFENWAARRFAAVVAATPYIASRFARLTRAIDIKNYPVMAEMATPVDGTGRQQAICYVGGVSRMRGAVEMVRALEGIDAKLILAGKMENSGLEAELRALRGWRKVEYRGLVGRAEVAQILAEARVGLVLLHPMVNYLDSLPVKMFEYMSAGLPVVASNFPLWRQLLDEVGAGTCVDPLDPAAIARAVNQLLENPERAAAMGQAGREAVLTTYFWEKEAAKLAALYGSLVQV